MRRFFLCFILLCNGKKIDEDTALHFFYKCCVWRVDALRKYFFNRYVIKTECHFLKHLLLCGDVIGCFLDRIKEKNGGATSTAEQCDGCNIDVSRKKRCFCICVHGDAFVLATALVIK